MRRAFCALLLLALLAASAVGKPQYAPSKGGNLGGGGGGKHIPTSNTYPSGPCVPGSQVKFQCNTCTCSGNGRVYFCTRQACPNLPGTGSSKCVPGTRFKSEDGCNDCYCSPNGTGMCTARGCVDLSVLRPPKSTKTG